MLLNIVQQIPENKRSHILQMLLRSLFLTAPILCFILTFPIYAQPIGDGNIDFPKNKKGALGEWMKTNQPKQTDALAEEQKRILAKAVDEMSGAEVDASLQKYSLSTSGSLSVRKDRLKIALQVIPVEPLPLPENEARISIENANEGEMLEGEEKRKLLKLRGRIRVKTEQGTLYADLVIVDADRKEIYAEGNLIYESEDKVIRGERMIYDQRLHAGIIYNTSGYVSPVYFMGKNIKMIDEHKFTVSHVYFTGCAAELPHYNFTARKVWIYENEKFAAVGAVLSIGGVPVLPVPFLFASPWGTGLLSQIGHSSMQGYFMQNTYQFGIPQAYLSSFLPTYYRLTADFYEKTGNAGGAEMYRFSPELNYVLQFGGANYKRYQVEEDFRSKNSFEITNRVLRRDGTYGREIQHWYKAFALINARDTDRNNNHVSNLHIHYENYTHRFYDYEYAGRYTPQATIPALYASSESGRGLIHDDTNWNMVYNETWDDLNLRVEATRNRMWKEKSEPADSHYVPQNDTLPSIEISKKLKLATIPWMNAPLYWDNLLNVRVFREYSDGVKYRTQNDNQVKSALRSYFSFYPFITFSPVIGVGAQRSIPYGEQMSSVDLTTWTTELKKNSYQFFYTEDELVLGPETLYIKGIYRRKESYKEELKDRSIIPHDGFTGSRRVNEVEASVGTNPFPMMSFSITSVYDMRKFEYKIPERERWSYPVFRSDFHIDFINFFRQPRENLLSRQKIHFLGTRITNEYVYDTVEHRDHSNVLGWSFDAGGFNLWPLKRLRYFETGFYWYHVYYNPYRDHFRYTMKLDLQLTQNIYFETQLESRATDVSRYQKKSKDKDGKSNYVAFEHDVLNGIGVNGQQKRKEAAFNVGYYEATIVLDLHDIEMRFGYSMEQKAVLGGVQSYQLVNFYDNRVFVSVNLLNFDGEGSLAGKPSRFLINRRQVRSSAIGRTSPTSVGNYN